jgi:very-short-patch-repair endonuclease
MPHRAVPKSRRTNARALRTDMTDAERKLWYRLRAHRFNDASFRRQVPIGPYIADFVCLKARLIVEVDGGQHGTERDATRDAWLRNQDFRVLRFWNNDVHSNLDGVLHVIAETLERALPPSLTLPRKGGGDATAFVDRTNQIPASAHSRRPKRGVTSPLAGEVGGEAAGRGVNDPSDHAEGKT